MTPLKKTLPDKGKKKVTKPGPNPGRFSEVKAEEDELARPVSRWTLKS